MEMKQIVKSDQEVYLYATGSESQYFPSGISSSFYNTFFLLTAPGIR